MDVSFPATGALMAGAFLVVLFTKIGDPSNTVLSLELAITFLATISYTLYVLTIKGRTVFHRDDIPKLRYAEWAITTPLMLIALCMILKGKKPLSPSFLVKIIGLDWLMLLMGYLGEMGYLRKTNACLLGFVPFLLIFYMIYAAFSFNVLYVAYVLIWGLYGVTFLMEQRVVATNVLDSIAKAGVAIAYCVR
jgi:Bacteriorhodopsin-like protein